MGCGGEGVRGSGGYVRGGGERERVCDDGEGGREGDGGGVDVWVRRHGCMDGGGGVCRCVDGGGRGGCGCVSSCEGGRKGVCGKRGCVEGGGECIGGGGAGVVAKL